jgi:hypothetical protein
MKPNGRKNTNINVKILYEIIFLFIGFHSNEQPVRPSSKVYFDQPNNGIIDQNNEYTIDAIRAIDTFLLVIFFIFDASLST